MGYLEELDRDDRLRFKAGDVLTVVPMGEATRRSLPAGSWVTERCEVVAKEDGCSGGLDVYDVDAGGEERSVYGVQVDTVTPGGSR